MNIQTYKHQANTFYVTYHDKDAKYNAPYPTFILIFYLFYFRRQLFNDSTQFFLPRNNIKLSPKSASYLKCVSENIVRVGIRSLRWKRVTLSTSTLQVTISNHVCKEEALNHCRLSFTLNRDRHEYDSCNKCHSTVCKKWYKPPLARLFSTSVSFVL